MKLVSDASEMLADVVSEAPPPITNSDEELIIITAVCSTLISVTGLIMAAILCSWCFSRKKYESDEEESLNEYKPVAYGGEDTSSIRDSSIAGITPNQSPSHNGSAQCNSSSTQHLTSVGNKKSSKLFRFDRHHGDKHKAATEHAQPLGNTNQVAHMVTEESVSFTQQKRRSIKEKEPRTRLKQRCTSIPLEVLSHNPQTTNSQDDSLKTDPRKESITSIKSLTDKAYNIFGLNENKNRNDQDVIEEVPSTSSQTPQTKTDRKNSNGAKDLMAKAVCPSLSNAYKSSWHRIKAKLPLILALKRREKEKQVPKKRSASMFTSREEFLRQFTVGDSAQETKPSGETDPKRKGLLRRFSLDSHPTVQEKSDDTPPPVYNVQQLISLFKEKIQEESDKPERNLRRESKTKIRHLKRKCQTQKVTFPGNLPLATNSTRAQENIMPPSPPPKSSQNADPSKASQGVASGTTDQTVSPDICAQRFNNYLRRGSRVMTEEEKQKSYVNLIKRRREVQQMRKQYMQKTGTSVEVDSFELDPPIPADVAL